MAILTRVSEIKKDKETEAQLEANCIVATDHGDRLLVANTTSVVNLPGTMGVALITPNTETSDMAVENLTVIGVEKLQFPALSGNPGYSGLDGYVQFMYPDVTSYYGDTEVVLDAVTDLNPKNVIKILAYATQGYGTSQDLTLNLLNKELQHHFAIIFPEPKAE